jgi:hypothetical protein
MFFRVAFDGYDPGMPTSRYLTCDNLDLRPCVLRRIQRFGLCSCGVKYIIGRLLSWPMGLWNQNGYRYVGRSCVLFYCL